MSTATLRNRIKDAELPAEHVEQAALADWLAQLGDDRRRFGGGPAQVIETVVAHYRGGTVEPMDVDTSHLAEAVTGYE